MQITELQPVVVVADPDQLRQVFDNLLDNGIKYNRPEGTVTVSIQREQGKAVVEVVDSGIGIRPEVLPHIFDRFVRGDTSRSRKGGGAGLGLSIARTLVDSMGGRIEVESQVDRGTTFRIALPTKDEI